MGYTRIEPEAGGAASFAALSNKTRIWRTRGANMAQRRKIARTLGDGKRGSANEAANRLHRESTHYKQKTNKTKQNKTKQNKTEQIESKIKEESLKHRQIKRP